MLSERPIEKRFMTFEQLLERQWHQQEHQEEDRDLEPHSPLTFDDLGQEQGLVDTEQRNRGIQRFLAARERLKQSVMGFEQLEQEIQQDCNVDSKNSSQNEHDRYIEAHSLDKEEMQSEIHSHLDYDQSEMHYEWDKDDDFGFTQDLHASWQASPRQSFIKETAEPIKVNQIENGNAIASLSPPPVDLTEASLTLPQVEPSVALQKLFPGLQRQAKENENLISKDRTTTDLSNNINIQEALSLLETERQKYETARRQLVHAAQTLKQRTHLYHLNRQQQMQKLEEAMHKLEQDKKQWEAAQIKAQQRVRPRVEESARIKKLESELERMKLRVDQKETEHQQHISQLMRRCDALQRAKEALSKERQHERQLLDQREMTLREREQILLDKLANKKLKSMKQQSTQYEPQTEQNVIRTVAWNPPDEKWIALTDPFAERLQKDLLDWNALRKFILDASKQTPLKEILLAPGKSEFILTQGYRLTRYPNGTLKLMDKNQIMSILFANGDMKYQSEALSLYFYAASLTTHATYEGEADVYLFQSGQCEIVYDRESELDRVVLFVDGTVKRTLKDGTTYSRFVDGTIQSVDGDQQRTLWFADGVRERYHKEWRERLYPDGRWKRVYKDGRVERGSL